MTPCSQQTRITIHMELLFFFVCLLHILGRSFLSIFFARFFFCLICAGGRKSRCHCGIPHAPQVRTATVNSKYKQHGCMMIFVEHAMTTSERTEPTSAYHLHYSDASQCSNSNLMSGLALALRMECYRRQPKPHANVSRRLSAAVWHEVDRIIDQTTRSID